MILVDSDAVVAHLRGSVAASDWLVSARKDGPLAISVVSIAELIGGMWSIERRDLMRRYHCSHNKIGLGDYRIAATADVKGLQLATLNVRHFPMCERLQPPFSL